MMKDLIAIPAFTPTYLASLGVDVRRLLEVAGMPATQLRDGKAWVSTRQYFALWNAIQTLGVGRDFGLRAGSIERLQGQYDVATIAALHSATFGEAIDTIARYKRMVCPGRWLLERQGQEAVLEFRWLLAPEQAVPDFLTDGAFAYIAHLYRHGSGGLLSLHRVELTRRTAHAEMLQHHFGCMIVFNAPRDLLVFERSALDSPFQTHNPELIDLMRPGLESALRDQVPDASWAEVVRDTVQQHMHGRRPTLQSIAKTLCVGSRTLQRRLGAVGTTYQEVLDDVRHRTACRLLKATDLDQGEIAFYLGFEEMNSFTRAFHGWEGQTPMQWRFARLSCA